MPTEWLHSYIVKVAAGTIAANRFDGYLSHSSIPGSLPIKDIVLPAGDYYYYVPNESHSDSTYVEPVVPTFRGWRFPHDQIPEPLSWVSFTPVISDKTRAECQLTRNTVSIEKCHVIPSSEGIWFDENEMERYDTYSGTRDWYTALNVNPTNSITLRSDIHFLWDNRYLTLLPFKTPELSRDISPILVGWAWQSYDEVFTYHGVPILSKAFVYENPQPEYLFVRFALPIFQNLKSFFRLKSIHRLVQMKDGSLDRISVQGFGWFLVTGSRSRSRSTATRCSTGAEDTTDDEELTRGRTVFRGEPYGLKDWVYVLF